MEGDEAACSDFLLGDEWMEGGPGVVFAGAAQTVGVDGLKVGSKLFLFQVQLTPRNKSTAKTLHGVKKSRFIGSQWCRVMHIW